ncbi:MAG: ECF-type sigma factor [Pirellulales bacterium]
MSEITQLLSEIEEGEPVATERLLPLVYDELRRLAAARMAAEASGHTLQPTALVHEAYLRLVGSENGTRWETRGHFFGAAAEAMRRILIESARRKKAEKRGGKLQRVDVSMISAASDMSPDDLFDLDQAFSEFAVAEPEKAALVKLRFFGGLSESEAANCLGISRPTASRHWAFARAWLLDRMKKTRDQ